MTSIRRDELHRIDDVAVEDCLFRLERMAADEKGDTWWLGLSRGDQSMNFELTSASPIEVTFTQDNLSRQSRGRKK